MKQWLFLAMLAGSVAACGENSTGEQAPDTCRDGLDNDNDQAIDCADSDCAGFVFCSESTSMTCQDSIDNDGDERVDCDDEDCAGFTFCYEREDTFVQCTDGVDNDRDQLIDCVDPDCFSVPVCSPVHGFPLIDSWGETWDGLPRSAVTFDVARTTCESIGGRLPTPTEIYRNNATSGTADIGTVQQNEWLWTFVRSVADYPVIVRVSDGSGNHAPDTATHQFRCVWTDRDGFGFDKDRCYGPPGAECFGAGLENVDAYDRISLDYAAAAAECAFYGASIPAVAEWGELIHSGLPNPEDVWLWSGKATYWYINNYGVSGVRWRTDTASRWGYNSAAGFGAVLSTTSWYNFRCVGMANQADAVVAAPSGCAGGCFTTTERRSPLTGEGNDRAAVNWASAFETCRALGGELPNQADFADLVHAGWPNGSDQWLWLTDTVYWYPSNYGHALAQFNASDGKTWTYRPGKGGVTTAGSFHAFRCVWRSRRGDLPTCATGQVVRDQGGTMSCADPAPGNAGGNAVPNGTGFADRFNNVWDAIARPAMTHALASDACVADGGRLPIGNEIYAVRATEPDSIGDTSDIALLWTTTPSANGGARLTVRISDGGSGDSPETAAQPYRCIWPAEHGDILSGRVCYGPRDAECFQVGTSTIADAADRVAAHLPSAIEECRAVGGHLTDAREFATLSHAGWENGADRWLWLAETVYWYPSGYGYTLARFTGTAMTDWAFMNPTTGTLDYYNGLHQFRCVHSTLIR